MLCFFSISVPLSYNDIVGPKPLGLFSQQMIGKFLIEVQNNEIESISAKQSVSISISKGVEGALWMTHSCVLSSKLLIWFIAHVFPESSQN